MNARGFTLIEILIALAIFSLIGLASTSILTTVIDSDELSSQRFAELEKLQRAMLTIERDILQATPRAVRIAGESNSLVLSGGEGLFDSEADGLGFVRGGVHNPQMRLARSSLQPVAYRLQEEQLQRIYSNHTDNPIGHEAKIKTLMEGIIDFQVQFLTANTGDEDNDEWQDSYTGERLPLAIAISFESKVFGVIRREFYLGSGQLSAVRI